MTFIIQNFGTQFGTTTHGKASESNSTYGDLGIGNNPSLITKTKKLSYLCKFR